MTTADTIRELSREHCTGGGLVMGQCLTAVGWVGGTVPDCGGVTELSMADVAGGGIAVGSALARRTIYVVRYQGFLTYNLPSIVNYAAKSLSMWNTPCPLLLRAIAMEGGIGPVASGSQHGLALRMPGIDVAAPMTPGEWAACFKHWQASSAPLMLSEHRWSFGITSEMPDSRPTFHARVTLIAIGAARLNAVKAAETLANAGIPVALYHLVWLKPLAFGTDLLQSLRLTRLGLVIDSDAECFGPSAYVALQAMQSCPDSRVFALGQEDRTAGFAPALDHGVPTVERIVERVKELTRKGRR